jgi:hypothetical protein
MFPPALCENSRFSHFFEGTEVKSGSRAQALYHLSHTPTPRFFKIFALMILWFLTRITSYICDLLQIILWIRSERLRISIFINIQLLQLYLLRIITAPLHFLGTCLENSIYGLVVHWYTFISLRHSFWMAWLGPDVRSWNQVV